VQPTYPVVPRDTPRLESKLPDADPRQIDGLSHPLVDGTQLIAGVHALHGRILSPTAQRRKKPAGIAIFHIQED
jgi:hypothetical protein